LLLGLGRLLVYGQRSAQRAGLLDTQIGGLVLALAVGLAEIILYTQWSTAENVSVIADSEPLTQTKQCRNIPCIARSRSPGKQPIPVDLPGSSGCIRSARERWTCGSLGCTTVPAHGDPTSTSRFTAATARKLARNKKVQHIHLGQLGRATLTRNLGHTQLCQLILEVLCLLQQLIAVLLAQFVRLYPAG